MTMQEPLRWSPFGPATRRYRDLDAEGTVDEALFARVTVRAEQEFAVQVEQVALAWELATWQAGLSRGERRALFLLAAVTFVDQARGSTRTPVRARRGREHLAGVLEALLREPDPLERAEADVTSAVLPSAAEVLATVVDLVRAAPERLGTVVRSGDVPTPGGSRDGEAEGETGPGPTAPAPALAQPLVLEAGRLYHHRAFMAERRVAASLRERLARAPEPAFAAGARGEAVCAVLGGKGIRGEGERGEGERGEGEPLLAPEQREAAELALDHAVSVISGGPGTGKTFVVLSLLRLLVRLGIRPEEVALAAPTAKAAQRLRTSLEAGLAGLGQLSEPDRALAERLPEARTLHRLLGVARRGAGVRHHEHAPLDAKVVVVDEASMVDLHLMDRLLRAVPPLARLLLVGDVEQLPAVGAGAILRDLVAAPAHAEGGARPGLAPAVLLTRSYRVDAADPAGAAILALAATLRDDRPGEGVGGAAGAALRSVAVVRSSAADLAFEGVEALVGTLSRERLGAFLSRWFARFCCDPQDMPRALTRTYAPDAAGAFAGGDEAMLDRLFARADAARILCPLRVGPQGAEAINAALHEAVAVQRGAPAGVAFCVGEPVMATANDYDRGLVNGDVGLGLWVRSPRDGRTRPQAVFSTAVGYRAFHLDHLADHVVHAFATTIHKAQGSEYDHVALVLPERDAPLLTREALYTAVTRARRSVVVLAPSEERFEVARQRSVERFSGLGERLRSR